MAGKPVAEEMIHRSSRVVWTVDDSDTNFATIAGPMNAPPNTPNPPETSLSPRTRRPWAMADPSWDDPSWDGAEDQETVLEEKTRTKRPRLFKVLLHNDDYTTTDFVVDILVRYFNKPIEEATRVMLQVHYGGTGIAGLYPREIAETKIAQVTAEAEKQQMPLLVTMEPE